MLRLRQGLLSPLLSGGLALLELSAKIGIGKGEIDETIRRVSMEESGLGRLGKNYLGWCCPCGRAQAKKKPSYFLIARTSSFLGCVLLRVGEPVFKGQCVIFFPLFENNESHCGVEFPTKTAVWEFPRRWLACLLPCHLFVFCLYSRALALLKICWRTMKKRTAYMNLLRTKTLFISFLRHLSNYSAFSLRALPLLTHGLNQRAIKSVAGRRAHRVSFRWGRHLSKRTLTTWRQFYMGAGPRR